MAVLMSQTPSPSAQTNAVRAAYQFDMQLAMMLQAKDFYCQVCHAVAHLTTCVHSMLYVLTEDQNFQFQGCKDVDKANRTLRPANTDTWRALRAGKTTQGNQSGDFSPIQALIRSDAFAIVPVIQKMSLIALIVIAREDNEPPSAAQILIAEHLAIPIRNALFMREREKQLQKRLQKSFARLIRNSATIST
jgi:hypothetical protein